MPWEGANGLLPGRGPEAPGRGAPGRGAEEESAAGAAGAAGFSAAFGAGAAGAAGAGAGAAGLLSALGAGAAGFSAAGAEASAGASAAGAAGAGAAGRGPELAGLDAGLDAASGNAPRSFLTTGASMVEDAERTNSPSSCSFATASFEVMPSSLASSCTRTLATFLLSRSAPSQARTVYLLRASTADAAGPITEHNKVLIAGYSSGFHQISDPLSGWTVSRGVPGRTRLLSFKPLCHCRGISLCPEGTAKGPAFHSGCKACCVGVQPGAPARHTAALINKDGIHAIPRIQCQPHQCSLVILLPAANARSLRNVP